MGLFDFVKNAGAKIGIGKSTKEEAAEKAEEAAAAASAREDAAEARAAQAQARQEQQQRLERAERVAEARKSNELEKYVRDLGFEVEGLDIRYDDEKATIKGTVTDSATREKVILAVGNVDGVAQVEDDIKVTAPPEPQAAFHTVVSGDTLSKIAKEYYGDPMRYPEIFEANRPMLKDPDLIYPGQVLRIPGAGGSADPGGSSPSRPASGVE